MWFFTKKISQPFSAGIRSAINNLILEITIYLIHRKGVIQSRKFLGCFELKLHLGCGPRIKNGWLNIDLSKNADIPLDLRKPLPFNNDSISVIYSEHFLEHLDYPGTATLFLKECNRVLRPGGKFSVVVPDIALVLRSYFEGGTKEYYAAQKKWHPAWCNTQMEHINFNFRQNGEHRFCYDFETLKNLMQRIGFKKIRQREFDPDLDSKDREIGSLYVDCLKLGQACS